MVIRMTTRRLLMTVAAGIAAAGLPAVAWAHAHLQQSSPAANDSVRSAPTDVRLWFTERLEPSLSSVKVLNASGKQVDKGDTHADPDDGKQLIVTLGSLAPGTYKVVWHAVSVDTHVTNGTFAFTVAR